MEDQELMTARLVRGTLALLAVILLAPAPSAAPAQAQTATCEFRFGFKALRDLIPNQVGDCVTNESHNPLNGDGLQQTTKGLMVWRHADNWTAFTDGTTTWINGPLGLQSRPNGERFSWEPAGTPAAAQSSPATPPQPPTQPATAAVSEPPAAPTPTPQPASATAAAQASGPIEKSPNDLVLALGDVGKQIDQVYLKTGNESGANWAESRYNRDPELLNARLGPLKVVSRVYVASNVQAAESVYRQELGRQERFPEADERLGGKFTPQGIEQFGDVQNARSACNDNCNTSAFNRLHQRAVLRHENAVVVVYFWGRDDQATPGQMNEWLRLIRGRL
jgi:hypothetical protein